MEDIKSFREDAWRDAARVKTAGGGVKFSPAGHQNQPFQLWKLLFIK